MQTASPSAAAYIANILKRSGYILAEGNDPRAAIGLTARDAERCPELAGYDAALFQGTRAQIRAGHAFNIELLTEEEYTAHLYAQD